MSADLGAVRSLLFTPASDAIMLAGAGRYGADAIVLDLEDAVAGSAKEEARRLATEYLPRIEHPGLSMVRINGLATGLAEEDLDAVVSPRLDAVVLPKVETPADLERVETMLEERERERGIPAGQVKVLALVETGLGISEVDRIAGGASPRLHALVLGSGDLGADLDLRRLDDGMELAFARSAVVIASRAHGLAAPLDGPYLSFRDVEGLAAECRRSHAFGFRGRVVVHPSQLPVVHRSYGGTSAEVQRLRAIVEAFEAAERRGVAAIDVAGTFVDYPTYRQACRTLKRHRASSEEPVA
jgi:citrate lyase subunit beta/citryl-CoA lyase